MSWFVKIILWLGLFTFVAFETGSVLVNRVQAADLAATAAQDAAFTYRDVRDFSLARNNAAETARRGGGELTNLVFSSDGLKMVATVRRRGRTILTYRIGPLVKYTIVTRTQDAPIPEF